MVTDAVWVDINKDGWMDLVVVGQFMPVTVFENHQGILLNKTNQYGLSETNGWWNRIKAVDLKGDGHMDLIVGNLGLNTQLKASADKPVTITYSDFNEDGTLMPLLCYYIQGKSYPYYTRDELMDQIPWLQKKFARYADFADAQLSDIFPAEKLAVAKTIKINLLESVLLQNTGNHRLEVKKLPMSAQTSMVNGIVDDHIQGKGSGDLILAGNFYPFRSQFGPLDAGIGTVLLGDGKGSFATPDYPKTGLDINGDVRNLIKVNGLKGKYWLIAAKSDGEIQVIERNNQPNN